MTRTVQQFNELSIAAREEVAHRMGYASPSEALRHACEWAEGGTEENRNTESVEQALFEDWMTKHM